MPRCNLNRNETPVECSMTGRTMMLRRQPPDSFDSLLGLSGGAFYVDVKTTGRSTIGLRCAASLSSLSDSSRMLRMLRSFDEMLRRAPFKQLLRECSCLQQNLRIPVLTEKTLWIRSLITTYSLIVMQPWPPTVATNTVRRSAVAPHGTTFL